MGSRRAAKKGNNPSRRSLCAGYEALSSELEHVVSTLLNHGTSQEYGLTVPVARSTERERVSTEMTWPDDLFHGQYFRQLAVETSSHEYSKVQLQE